MFYNEIVDVTTYQAYGSWSVSTFIHKLFSKQKQIREKNSNESNAFNFDLSFVPISFAQSLKVTASCTINSLMFELSFVRSISRSKFINKNP